MKNTLKVCMQRRNGVFVTRENDYAIANDSRNWWLIIPMVNGVIQYGSLETVYVNGTYRDAVNHISQIRS